MLNVRPIYLHYTIKNQPNVGTYTIHWASGHVFFCFWKIWNFHKTQGTPWRHKTLWSRKSSMCNVALMGSERPLKKNIHGTGIFTNKSTIHVGTLQGTNPYPTLGKRKIFLKSDFWWDMLVRRRVNIPKMDGMGFFDQRAGRIVCCIATWWMEVFRFFGVGNFRISGLVGWEEWGFGVFVLDEVSFLLESGLPRYQIDQTRYQRSRYHHVMVYLSHVFLPWTCYHGHLFTAWIETS